jgi:hypothetical protein
MPIGELKDNNKQRRKKSGDAERSREEGEEIEDSDHLQEDQRERAREFQNADARKQKQECSVIAEPEN